MTNHSAALLVRIAAILERARVAGGWIDEDVARAVLTELGLNDDGKPSDCALMTGDEYRTAMNEIHAARRELRAMIDGARNEKPETE